MFWRHCDVIPLGTSTCCHFDLWPMRSPPLRSLATSNPGHLDLWPLRHLALITRHVPCPGAFYLKTSILAKHDDLRYFWVLCLIIHAIMCYMTEDFFDEMIWTPWKSAKNPLGSWIQSSAGTAGSWAFFSKFWFDRGQNRITCDRGYKRHKLQQK